jgi:hypothetical protein
MENMTIMEMIELKYQLIEEGKNHGDFYNQLIENINMLKYEYLFEETSATGGPASTGMGAVVSAQPSGLAGATIGVDWASGGGTSGSGDIGVPYNPSGANRVFQKIPAPQMGKNHGARTGKKSRVKKLDMKALRNFSRDFEPNQKDGSRQKVLNFNDFLKNDFNTIKK